MLLIDYCAVDHAAFNEEEIRKFVDAAFAAAASLAPSAASSSPPFASPLVVPFVTEPKIDGLSLAVTYKQGVFFKAGTRGDGTTGEDVTTNARHVYGIPETIIDKSDAVEVRGEVYIRNIDMLELNTRRLQANKTIFSTPRNAAAGSLRQLGIYAA